MKLSDLKINTYAIILYIKISNKKSRMRLLEMGLVPGTLIKMTNKAPLNDPIVISFRGYELCINSVQASYIDVKALK